nr:hypothetical protein CFP56_79032 [Quercus suber]
MASAYRLPHIELIACVASAPDQRNFLIIAMLRSIRQMLRLVLAMQQADRQKKKVDAGGLSLHSCVRTYCGVGKMRIKCNAKPGRGNADKTFVAPAMLMAIEHFTSS